MFTELSLQKFDSLIDKCRNDFQRQIYGCDNGIVQHFVYLHLMWLFYVMCDCIAAFFSLSLSVSVSVPDAVVVARAAYWLGVFLQKM